MKNTILILLLIVSSYSYSQQLILKGTDVYQNDKKLSNEEIKVLYQATPEALNSYNEFKTESMIGSFFLGIGIGLVATDLAFGLTSVIEYPTAGTYIGLAAGLISIPLIANRKSNLKKSVNFYNEKSNKTSFKETFEVDFLATANGFGFKMAF